MSRESFVEHYHSFEIERWREFPQGDHRGMRWDVYLDTHFQFGQYVTITRSAMVTFSEEETKRKGSKLVKGRIDLRRYEVGDKYSYKITSTSEETWWGKSIQTTDQDIRRRLLQALYNIYRLQPGRAHLDEIDVEGFCMVLGVSEGDYEFNARILLNKGLIKIGPTQQSLIETGRVYITSEGLEYVEKTEKVDMRKDIMEAILKIQDEIGKDNMFITDTAIADVVGVPLKNVRDYLLLMADEDLLKITHVMGGDISALPTARGRVAVMNPSFLETADGSSTALTISGHNINIGMLNQQTTVGRVKSISASITEAEQQGNRELADALAQFTKAVTECTEINEDLQEELLQQLELLSEEASRPTNQRRKGLINSILATLPTAIQTVGALAEIWSVVGPTMVRLF